MKLYYDFCFPGTYARNLICHDLILHGNARKCQSLPPESPKGEKLYNALAGFEPRSA